MVGGKCILKIAPYEGLPKLSDLKIINTEDEKDLSDGEILTEAVYISVDPYLRLVFANTTPDQPVGGFQLAKVLQSNDANYPVDSLLYITRGWQTISRITAKDVWNRVDNIEPKIDPVSYMGVVGMPGLTAYWGFLEICQPKEGETVMVSTCSGAVGSVVGQIAKIKGCKVIGSCGSEEKMKYAQSIGYDGVFNYKTQDYNEALKRLAPEGIDCYFDNVGGKLSSAVLHHMNTKGRIAVCGAITSYNESDVPTAPMIQHTMIFKQLKMEGFMVHQYFYVPGMKEKAYSDLVNWVAQGKIKTRETMYQGFDSIPQAFIDLFLGKNIGKAVIKV